MKKIVILSLLILSAIHFQLLAQSEKSFQVNSGLLSTTNSHKGILGTVQFNYKINSSITFYAYSGILYWGQNIIHYFSVGESMFPKETYSEDSHKMIPLYIGGRYSFNNSSAFRPFVNAEFGVAFLTYNSYDLLKNTNTDGTRTYFPIFKNVHSESLFGAGIGLGVIHDMGKSLQLLLEFRINTVKNSNYSWFSSGGTLRTFQFGFGYKI